MSATDDAGPNRRDVLKLMGASLALAGLTACHPARQIVPYVRQPEDVIPGRKSYYATTLAIDGFGFGVLAESHEGRPTKIEGNPHHPASLGAADAILQASVLGLYDPNRAQTPTRDGVPAGYDAFLAEVATLRGSLAKDWGRSLAVLIGPETSPTLASQLAALRAQFPEMQLYRHAPLATPEADAASQAVFGRASSPLYHFDRAKVILSLDGDFLGEGGGKLAYARQFADARRVTGTSSSMSRLYAFASTPTLTSAKADHSRRLRASAMGTVLTAIADRLDGRPTNSDPMESKLLDAIAIDLRQAGPNALVIAGSRLDTATQAAAHRLNARLGAVGHTIDLLPPLGIASDAPDLHALADAIGAGKVDALLILGHDPVFTAPGDVDLAAAVKRVGFSAYWGPYADGTANACRWHIPAAHALEGWSDALGFDGTPSIVQPLIEPLHGGRTMHDVLVAFLGELDKNGRDLVRARWSTLDDQSWAQALKSGVIDAPKPTFLMPSVTATNATPTSPSSAPSLELNLVPDLYFRDGAFAPNTWLAELPRPLSRMVWGNAVEMSPATAKRLMVDTGDVVEITIGSRSIELPVAIEPNQADDTLTVPLGYGRLAGGAPVVGTSAYGLRKQNAAWQLPVTGVRKTGARQKPITIHGNFDTEGRDIIRTAALADFAKDPAVLARNKQPEPAPDDRLFPAWDNPEEAWGMVIDTGSCIGCMACVSACQAENNSPVVGPEQVALGREMHWLRVDRYETGDADAPQTHFQPVPCMQCENAPCEEVCPVNATVHTHDGLNAQVYNRCVGTRYCSQNCPYKVRRFNWLQYQDFSEDSPLSALMNPNVTVRERGVMEKCTYCVQRISAARIDAQDGNRPIRDGEVVTACQQTCPTHAITFGNLNDPRSAVRRAKAEPHNYVLLAELNTRPRTSYLADIRNSNGDADG